MATQSKRINDPIRIVPLREPKLKPAPSGAKLTYRGGPLLGAVEVSTIFWGGWWKQAPQATLVGKLNAFFDNILTSALIDQLAEYSTPATKIVHGKRVATLTVDAAPGTTVDDSAIVGFVKAQLAAGGVPKQNPNSLYFVYLPSGTTVTASGSASCSSFCGYHESSGSLYYAVEPYPDCTGCLGGLSAFDALCVTSSHELCESITDPVPGEGWYDDANGEIGDICAWQTKTLNGYTVQQEWSNNAAACV